MLTKFRHLIFGEKSIYEVRCIKSAGQCTTKFSNFSGSNTFLMTVYIFGSLQVFNYQIIKKCLVAQILSSDRSDKSPFRHIFGNIL